uniref:Beta-amyloid-like protein n=1 Tax=Amblyomma americanum TaxID=6943 RepID=B5M723_AMBAM
MRVLLVAAILFTASAAFLLDNEDEDYYEHGVKICGRNGSETECKALCSEQLEEGPCRAIIPRYGFNGRSCQMFFYGGCYGNNNSFATEVECMKACGKYKKRN